MYFNRYIPATKSENLETARAFHTFNAVCNFCGKPEPRFPDFVSYCAARDLTFRERILFATDPEAETLWAESLRAEWNNIRELVRNAGQPLRKQFVVYFAIINGGIKKGQTRDLVQRYSNINRETPIEKLWYLPVESEEESLLAEEILGNFFDHARVMKRCRGKDDYYQCDAEAAQRFITANAGKIYQAIAEAIEGI